MVNKVSNSRWAFEMQATMARSRNSLIMLDIVELLLQVKMTQVKTCGLIDKAAGFVNRSTVKGTDRGSSLKYSF